MEQAPIWTRLCHPLHCPHNLKGSSYPKIIASHFFAHRRHTRISLLPSYRCKPLHLKIIPFQILPIDPTLTQSGKEENYSMYIQPYAYYSVVVLLFYIHLLTFMSLSLTCVSIVKALLHVCALQSAVMRIDRVCSHSLVQSWGLVTVTHARKWMQTSQKVVQDF